MSASSWQSLIGFPVYKAGSAGTVTLPVGAVLIRVWCHSTAGGTCTIFGGDSIPIVANVSPFEVDFKHALFIATAAAPTVVFTTTDSYFVHYVVPHAS